MFKLSLRRNLLRVSVATGLLLIACSDRVKPPAVDNENPTPAPGFNPSGGDASTGSPTCVVPDAGPPLADAALPEVCGCFDFPFQGDPINVYFVLDRSGSMLADDKWGTIRVATSKLVGSIGARAKFGATIYPLQECTAGEEVMPLTLGDFPPRKGGPVALQFIASTNVPASGGTPTAPTLTKLLPKLRGLQGKTVVILATDGGPNCNEDAACDVTTCTLNIDSIGDCRPNQTPDCCLDSRRSCLDSEPMLAAIRQYKAEGIDVYVVGVPGSEPYANLLDQAAAAGGTARDGSPKYYRVDNTDTTAFESTIRKAAGIATANCTLRLGATPSNPGRLNVYLDDQVVTKEPFNGWTLSGDTIELVGSSCQRLKEGDALGVRVVAGCPTVELL
ncbi:MAG: VWA domain-containing protein [Polyangiaceae bacterium]|nr:VWA domain-containing protein [Polyangiaceae bacterium]